jgi:hypothetical protein
MNQERKKKQNQHVPVWRNPQVLPSQQYPLSQWWQTRPPVCSFLLQNKISNKIANHTEQAHHQRWCSISLAASKSKQPISKEN